MRNNQDFRRDEAVSAIRADFFILSYRYRRFCRSLNLFACVRFYHTLLRESDVKKEKSSPCWEGGGGPEEGGFERGRLSASCETSSLFRATLFFSAGFFSLEKKRVHHAEPQTILSASRTEFMCFKLPARRLRRNSAKRKIKKEASGDASLRLSG